MNLEHTALLVLEDGTTCYGKAFGAIGTTGGEICFNTGMTGYQEVFTDPSYYGQVLIMNSVHIGNYGVSLDDIESDSVKIKGLIGRNLEELFSRKRASGSLDEYLKKQDIVGIEGVDTRALNSKTMESKSVPGLHFIGEVVDVTGWLGGYNFQWAWASGVACGRALRA